MFVRSPPGPRTNISRPKLKYSYVGGTFDGLAKIRSAPRSEFSLVPRPRTNIPNTRANVRTVSRIIIPSSPEECSYGVAPRDEMSALDRECSYGVHAMQDVHPDLMDRPRTNISLPGRSYRGTLRRTREDLEHSALRIFARASTTYEHFQHVNKCSHGGPV